ncbi:hypothetical protein CCACVL1_13712 [Corchorus capsularis]|uniref:Uncharacterized protein n=1 Tax=Corchorus capsularis TaxID=210143 RepID=A0A1R3I9W9_COCAP|nr:hypothetical protein CCACVL1_13712 [Corchorus capsularis]
MGDWLELRQRLKESIRRRNGGAADVSSQGKNYNLGSFFGPTETLISERVKALLKDKDITPMLSKMSSQSSLNQNSNSASRPKLGQGHRLRVEAPKPKPSTALLKAARDYSFLSDGAELPAPTSDSDQAPSMRPKTKP